MAVLLLLLLTLAVAYAQNPNPNSPTKVEKTPDYLNCTESLQPAATLDNMKLYAKEGYCCAVGRKPNAKNWDKAGWNKTKSYKEWVKLPETSRWTYQMQYLEPAMCAEIEEERKKESKRKSDPSKTYQTKNCFSKKSNLWSKTQPDINRHYAVACTCRNEAESGAFFQWGLSRDPSVPCNTRAMADSAARLFAQRVQQSGAGTAYATAALLPALLALLRA